jgi:hypothetical protein
VWYHSLLEDLTMRRASIAIVLTTLLVLAGCPMMSVSDKPIHTDENTITLDGLPGRRVLSVIKGGAETDPQAYQFRDMGKKLYAAMKINDQGEYEGTPMPIRIVKLGEKAEFLEIAVLPGDDLMGIVVPHGYNPDGNYWFVRLERDGGALKLFGPDKKYADKSWTEDVGRLERHPDVRTREVKVEDDNTGDLKAVRVLDMQSDELQAFLVKHADEFNVHLWTLRPETKK